MFRFNMGVTLLASSMALSRGMRFTPSGGETLFDPSGEYRAIPRKSKGQNYRCGKGVQAKPRKRPNRLTISKRVRRKHRRAAK